MLDDLISRQAAIDALQKEIDKGIPPFDDVIGSIRCGVRLSRNIIEDLPSAQPERKEGKWLKPEYNKKSYIRLCTACNERCWYVGIGNYKFCPNCGAKMKEE